VQVRWVEDLSITGFDDGVILVDGVPEPIANWSNWIDYQGVNATFTRRFNPNDTTFDTRAFIGVPAGTTQDSIHAFNGNVVGGQGRHNIHVSMMTNTFMDGKATSGDLLQARLLSAAEMHFTLAEMALKGWSVGNAQSHYEAGVLNSLQNWGVGGQYNAFIQEVPFDGTVEQVLTQKWVALWTAPHESWNDYRRTGIPDLSLGIAALGPKPALRFGYGGDELVNNETNVQAAIQNLETTQYSGAFGKDSPYSKPWLLQGTGLPY
jgi:hypothetical protein